LYSGKKLSRAKAQRGCRVYKVFLASLRAFAPLREKTFATEPLSINSNLNQYLSMALLTTAQAES
jgi:hypothetical protein